MATTTVAHRTHAMGSAEATKVAHRTHAVSAAEAGSKGRAVSDILQPARLPLQILR